MSVDVSDKDGAWHHRAACSRRRLQGARVGLALLILLSIGLSTADVWMTVRGSGLDSDMVQSFLAARSILDGNVLLSGWHLARDNYFFTDTLAFVGLEPIFGLHSLVAFPTVIYAGIMAICIAASVRTPVLSHDSIISVAIITLLIGVPLPGPMQVPDTHVASILFSLAALLLLVVVARPGRWRDRPWSTVGFGLVTCAAVASDPFTLVFAFLPALIVLGVDTLSKDAVWRTLRTVAMVAACCVAGVFLTRAIRMLGGFTLEQTVSLGFVTPEHLGRTLQGIFFGLLSLAGANVLGKQLSAALGDGVRLAGWIFAVLAVYIQLRRHRHSGDVPLFDRMLVTGIILLTFSCAGSEMFDTAVGESVFTGGAAVRYLTPLLVFGALLAARAMPHIVAALPTGRLRILAIGLLVAAAGTLLVRHTVALARQMPPPWLETNPYHEIGQWLLDNNLTCGVGDYWNSSIVTAVMNDRVRVRAVLGPPKGPLAPFTWIASDRWYRSMQRPEFVIWSNSHPSNWFNVGPETAATTYGAPTRVERVGTFTISVLPQPTCTSSPP